VLSPRWLPLLIHRLLSFPARNWRQHRRQGADALVSGVSQADRATALNLVNLFFGLGGLATPFISANLFKRNWVRLCHSVAALTVVTLLIQAFTRMPPPARGCASPK